MQTVDATHADMMAIGKHCAFPDCGQLDFLPFRCACGQTFCLDHRTAQAHNCRLAGSGSKQVIACPICAKGVELGPQDDPNLVFDRHQAQGCDPANYARVHKKPRCPVRGCKEKLTTINTYCCKDCAARVCLRHRLASDHACLGPPAAKSAAAAAAGQRASAAFSAAAAASRSLGTKATSLMADLRSAATGTAAAAGAGARGARQQQPQHQQPQRQQQQQRQQQPADPANTLHGSAHRRQQQLQQQGAERCPQCGAVFSTVQDLIQHVDVAHCRNGGSAAAGGGAARQQQGAAAAAGGGAGGQEMFACPRCSQRFSDAVLLVAHSEACGRSEGNNCVLC